MKKIILYAAFVLMSSVASMDPGLRVRFDLSLHPGKNCFYDTPRTIEDAMAQNWTMMSRPPSPHPELVMYCKQCTLCTLFDCDTGKIAGVQVALPVDEVIGAPYSWDDQGFIPWMPSACAGTYVTKQVYFVSEKTLSKPVEERQQAALSKEVMQEDSIWVTDSDQQLMEIPIDVKGIEKVGFTEQACIPWMGLHYYYKMSSATKCNAKSMFTWFPLCHDGKMIGIGFVVVGGLNKKPGEIFYFEKPPKIATKVIVPRGPKCLYELAGRPSLTSIHIYFVDKPWTILCPLLKIDEIWGDH